VGAGVGFGITGDIAALSWRAAFILLALPAFGLAWAVARLPEPARGGGSPRPAGSAGPAGKEAVRGELSLLAAARYVLRIRTNLILIIASACGYYFLAGVEIFGNEFAKGQYHVNQVVASLVLLLLGAGAIPGVLA